MINSITTLCNYPNPFNPETTISYTLPSDSKVTLNVFNIRGEHVRTLFNGAAAKGSHSLKWDGKTDSGNSVGSGYYLYSLKSGNQTINRKMLLLK